MERTAQKKIRLVIGINDFRIGGGQKFVADVISNIDRSRFEVHLVTLIQFDEQESFYSVLPNDVSVHRFHFKKIADIRELIQLYRFLNKLRPGVVWASFFFSNTVFRILKPLVGYPVIITEQNTYAWKTFSQKIVDWLLSVVTFRIVAVSKYVAQYTAKQERIPSQKFLVIHNGVDVDTMTRNIAAAVSENIKRDLGLTPHDRLIINVGQLINQKNQHLLIDAFKQFSDQVGGYYLLILGEGILREELEKYVASLGLSGRVLLPGIRKNVADYYAVSDFFVLTSRFEGFSVAVVEALSAGLPVISTRVSGADEYIEEHITGFSVSDDVSDIAEKMKVIASASDAQRQVWRRSTREKAKLYDISVVTKKYETLFREAVQE